MKICFFGGEGVGKSTLAMYTAGVLKKTFGNVEFVSEYVKKWALDGKLPRSADQIYIFGKQVNAEDIVLRNGGIVVTDSPIYMQLAYSKKYAPRYYEYLRLLALEFDHQYPSLNFYVYRNVPYVAEGRFGSNIEEMDELILNQMLDKRANRNNTVCDLKYVTPQAFEGYIISSCMDFIEKNSKSDTV